MWVTLRRVGLIAAAQHSTLGSGRKDIAFDEARYDFPDEQHNDHQPRNVSRARSCGYDRDNKVADYSFKMGAAQGDKALKRGYPSINIGGVTMKISLTLLGLFAAPALAWANCPTAADMAAGIKLTQDDGTVEVYSTQSDILVLVDSYYTDGYQTRYTLAHGVYLLDRVDIEDDVPVADSRATYTFDMSPEQMPLPESGGRLRTRQVVRDFDGVYTDKVSGQWQDAVQMAFGDCTYTVIPGVIEYSSDGYSYTEGLNYLPELGLSYLSMYDDSEVNQPEYYWVRRIEKAKR